MESKYILPKRIIPKVIKYENIQQLKDIFEQIKTKESEVVILTHTIHHSIRKQIYEQCEENKIYCKGFLDNDMEYDGENIYKCIGDYDDEIPCNFKGFYSKWNKWNTFSLCENYSKENCNHQYCQGIQCPECGITYDSDYEPITFVKQNNCILISKNHIDNPKGFKNKSKKKK